MTALGSHLKARTASGEWLVRIVDADPPRIAAGAADDSQRTL